MSKTIEQQIDSLAAEAEKGWGIDSLWAYRLMRRCWQAERKLREADAMEWVEREDARMGRPIGEQRAKRQQRKAVLAEAEMILKGEV